MKLSRDELKGLMKNKMMQAGLKEEHAEQTAEILTWSHERGYASHGAVRVEYYSERIAKGGITNDPNITWKQTGPCSGIMDGDNGIGYWVATKATEKAIEIAKENGVAIVGMANISHTGSIGYYTEMCAKEGLAAITFCQSDPMAVPYGGTEPYYGTNPISFAAPTADERNVVFDMATTVQAWGKILDKRSQGAEIPSDWAVDENGEPVMEATGGTVKRMKLSADYDKTLQGLYEERKNRPEWDYVGMLGVLPVRDDGTCVPGLFCKCGADGIATLSVERGFDAYMVIERAADGVVKVILR